MTALATIADAGSHIDNLVFAGLLTLAAWTYCTVQIALLVHRARTTKTVDQLRELGPFLCPDCERRVQAAIRRYAR